MDDAAALFSGRVTFEIAPGNILLF